MKYAFLLLVAIIFNFQSNGQKIIVNGQETLGKLSWVDFSGKVDKSSTYNAYTSYSFKTKFGGVNFIGDSAIINGFEVILEFDHKKSWAKANKLTDELLVHEQGHFDIGILCVREIAKNFKVSKFTKANLNSLLQSITTEASKKYREMGLTYDAETNHSINKEQQLKWNNFFSTQLLLN